MTERVLYGYWRSSAAYRVRIGLNLKDIDYAQAPVHLARDGGEQHGARYSALNPQRLVPTFVDGDVVLTQSLAILEYLDEIRPAPALLPEEAPARARVRALALAIACDIHPLQNLRVLQALTGRYGLDEDGKGAWVREWITRGLESFEAMLSASPATGRFCHGDAPGLADVCLIPQLYNAERWGCDLTPFPLIRGIQQEAEALEAFAAAAPERQPDAV